jgi:transcription initiation factor IIE alpha subunit
MLKNQTEKKIKLLRNDNSIEFHRPNDVAERIYEYNHYLQNSLYDFQCRYDHKFLG